MEYLSSPKTKKINAIVCLKMLNELPSKLALLHFESLMKEVVPEIIAHLDINNGKQKIPKKNNPFTFSFRKKIIRSKQMFDDFDIFGFFKESVKKFESRVKEEGLSFGQFQRKELETNFLNLLGN